MTTTAQKPKKNGQPPASPPPSDPQTQNSKRPDLYAFATVPNGRSTRIGSRIGVVFNHKAGDGFTIYLDATPIPMDGQIEIVCYPPKP